jgi:hypothetical protein
MTKRLMSAVAGLGLLLTAGCPKGGNEPEPPKTTSQPEPQPVERPSLTTAECEAQGGMVVGDIGDGAIHRPDYVCEASGKPPIGTIRPVEGEPIAVEGSVCCPAPTSAS